MDHYTETKLFQCEIKLAIFTVVKQGSEKFRHFDNETYINIVIIEL